MAQSETPRASGLRLGIDLGGTKIEIACLDAAGGFRLRRRVTTPRSYDATIEAIAMLVEGAEAEARRDHGLATGEHLSLGLGIPGTISPATELVKNANSTWLNGRPLKADLEHRLARPLRFANDANCLTLSEALDGAAAGARSIFGVIVGTGVGGGLVHEGRLVTGANAIAGEWGHCPLPYPQPEDLPAPSCWCGRPGCIETYLSGPGLARDYRAQGGEALSGQEIVARAEAGEPLAEAAMLRYEDRLARALSLVINIFDPEVIVLGGGLSRIQRLYPALARLLPPRAFSDRLDLRILPARHGDSSGVRGAAFLWPLPEA